MRHVLSSLLVAAAFLAGAVAMSECHAQPAPRDQPDMPIDAAGRHEILEAAAKEMERAYIFPEAAARMSARLREREAAGAYDKLDAKAFARAVTDDLQSVSHDKHLRLLYSHAPIPERRPGPPDAASQDKRAGFERSINQGFERAERLDGNVGYLEMRMFVSESPRAFEVASAAMSFLADTDALIIDLRRNGGGDPAMVAYVSSYLFDERTHLNDLYWRERERTDEFWTRADVPGRKFGTAKPVYVLTSKRTFSGAEEFANNLQALKRATIVGETTGGGAHPGGTLRLSEHFQIWLPQGRAINPITKTNWEGTGVVPDVPVPADQALEKAKELARKALGSPPPRG